jgi:hypothetical protein
MDLEPKMYLYGYGELRIVDVCISKWVESSRSCAEFGADAVNSIFYHIKGLSQQACLLNAKHETYIIDTYFTAMAQAALYEVAADSAESNIGIEAERILFGETDISCDLTPLIDRILDDIFGRDTETGN